MSELDQIIQELSDKLDRLGRDAMKADADSERLDKLERMAVPGKGTDKYRWTRLTFSWRQRNGIREAIDNVEEG